MSSKIKGFTVLTTHGGDRLPTAIARTIDKTISGLESRHDAAASAQTLLDFADHIASKGQASHGVVQLTGTAEENFAQLAYGEYKKTAASPLSFTAFKNLYMTDYIRVLSLLRRGVLTYLKYVEGVGLVSSETAYYTADTISEELHLPEAAIVLTEATSGLRLSKNVNGSEPFYYPEPMGSSIPASGCIVIRVQSLNASPTAEEVVIDLTGSSGYIRVSRLTGDINHFRVDVSIGGSIYTSTIIPESGNAGSLSIAINFKIDHCAVYYADGEIVKSYHHTATPGTHLYDTLGVHKKLTRLDDRTINGSLRHLFLYDRPLSDNQVAMALAI